ncbi:MAG: alkaline phosphatase [Acidobacteria bacterium]|nr:alkaline phosphatase [Acidobacteriota bacterium]
MKVTKRLLAITCILSFAASAWAQVPQAPFPVKRTESAETWQSGGWAAVDAAKRTKIRKKAKNVIIFVGDGMGISTLTAARIFEGQQRGESGEENRLSFEMFPYTALSKTYSADQQTSDSAPTMSAIITGVKTDEGVISVNQKVVRSDWKTVAGNETKSLFAYAEDAGLSTGVVSTARLTHATPAACYANTPDRDWESDADILRLNKPAYEAKFPDIASQMLEFNYGIGLEVAIGGGRSKFLPKDAVDPEYAARRGERLDGRDLTAEWLKIHGGSQYVWNKQQFDAVDARKTKHLLGLFEPSHMQYEYDRAKDPAGEPSLSEMTAKSIDILANNKKGYVLMVEAGRIDHAHHDGNAYRALTDTVELSNAVRTAVSKVNLDETLIVVTADHSHTIFIQGYPARGNNILGLAREVGPNGTIDPDYKLDRDKKPYTTLGYANGPGAKAGDRPVLTQEEVLKPDYKQEARIPFGSETHGGEDVAIFAIGPNAQLFRGSMEQNWIFYVMADALRLGRK